MTLTTINRFPPFFREFEQLFRDVPATREVTPRAIPAADVVENDKAVEIHLDMPGVNPEQIDVKLEGDQLTITAERVNAKTDEKAGWIRQERTWGTFSRSFSLPDTLDGTKPAASYKHGVLTVTLPKKEEVQPRTLKVKVEA
jgi:HSP20 family protein